MKYYPHGRSAITCGFTKIINICEKLVLKSPFISEKRAKKLRKVEGTMPGE
jgi:hypothetical protein